MSLEDAIRGAFDKNWWPGKTAEAPPPPPAASAAEIARIDAAVNAAMAAANQDQIMAGWHEVVEAIKNPRKRAAVDESWRAAADVVNAEQQ
jgi:hypothetical protein